MMPERRPFVHLNFAVAADGRMASDSGDSLPISSDEDWRRVHDLRERYDAVAVGAVTFRGDRPRLDVRRERLGREPARQPDRVIFGGGHRCSVAAEQRRTFLIGSLAGEQPGIVRIRARDRRLSGPLAALRRHGVRSLLVEGGPTLLASFLSQGLWDRLTAYVPTGRAETARRAVATAIPGLEGLRASPLGRGTLLAAERPPRAPS